MLNRGNGYTVVATDTATAAGCNVFPAIQVGFVTSNASVCVYNFQMATYDQLLQCWKLYHMKNFKVKARKRVQEPSSTNKARKKFSEEIRKQLTRLLFHSLTYLLFSTHAFEAILYPLTNESYGARWTILIAK